MWSRFQRSGLWTGLPDVPGFPVGGFLQPSPLLLPQLLLAAGGGGELRLRSSGQWKSSGVQQGQQEAPGHRSSGQLPGQVHESLLKVYLRQQNSDNVSVVSYFGEMFEFVDKTVLRDSIMLWNYSRETVTTEWRGESLQSKSWLFLQFSVSQGVDKLWNRLRVYSDLAHLELLTPWRRLFVLLCMGCIPAPVFRCIIGCTVWLFLNISR